MQIKRTKKYKTAMQAAKSIKKARNPIEKRLAVRRWCDAAREMLNG